MALARHWRLYGCRLRTALSCPKGIQELTGKSYCSMDKPIDLQPLTLENLGFRDDDGEDIDGELMQGHQGRRHLRQNADIYPKKFSSRAEAASVDEKKQAALDASYILAKLAGMHLEKRKSVDSALTSAGKAKELFQQQEGKEDEEEEMEDEAEGEGNRRRSTHVKQEAHEAAQALALNHPWPEWLEFLGALQRNGFFEGAEKEVEEEKHLFESFAAVKLATNAFGRNHTESFNCLSRKDLRVLAHYGCPDAERKASNASKRLRAHFQIKEGDVCQGCRLKMTCPRAYFAPESKLSMNTLDVVRIITGYATNVWPNADSHMSYPVEVGTSACNLLREFLTYKVSPRDAAEDKDLPTERMPLDSEKSVNKKLKTNPLPVEEKPGDWTCPNCEFRNFGRNRRCRECRVCRPPRQEMKTAYAGDWHCPKCRYMNFSKNSQCRECRFERPTSLTWMGGERLPDDGRASNKLSNKERKYEASDEEGVSEISLMSPDGSSEPNSDASFSDEEERALAKGLAMAAEKLRKPSFQWDEVKEGAESFLHLNVTRKATKLPKGKSKRNAKVSRMQ